MYYKQIHKYDLPINFTFYLATPNFVSLRSIIFESVPTEKVTKRTRRCCHSAKNYLRYAKRF